MKMQDIDYHAAAAVLRGVLVEPVECSTPKPAVLVFHEGTGLGDFAIQRAWMLAELGYVAFAADMFGDRKQARNLQQVATSVGQLRAQPELLRSRAHAALVVLATMPRVDPSRIAAIGFCFGGTVALELARSGADLKAAVSFHGGLTTAMPAASGAVKASILVCTGADDPLAPPEQVADFEQEMRAAEVRDWQVVSYGNTLHGFTNPAADGSMMRTARYSEQADRRSWLAMRHLLEEVFR